jgi:hypothetical protein
MTAIRITEAGSASSNRTEVLGSVAMWRTRVRSLSQTPKRRQSVKHYQSILDRFTPVCNIWVVKGTSNKSMRRMKKVIVAKSWIAAFPVQGIFRFWPFCPGL